MRQLALILAFVLILCGTTMFKLPAFNDGDTFATNFPVAGWWVSETNNPDTQAEAGINVGAATSGTTTTFTFYPARNGATANFFIAR
jgi:hypothetical protein